MYTETNIHTGRRCLYLDKQEFLVRVIALGYKPEPFFDDLHNGIELEGEHAWFSAIGAI